MKRIHLFCFALFIGCSGLFAQNKQLLYDFVEIPQALMVNPGMQTDFKWYAGVPLLSGLSVQAGTSGLSVHDIFADDGLDINDKVRERAVYGLNTRDMIGTTVQIELLSGGFRPANRPKDFYSFGIYHETDFVNYWPQDLAFLGYDGNANQLGRRYRLDDLKLRGEILNVFHFGINREVNPNLTVGARAKIYSGILDFNSTANEGYFVTNEGQENLLSSTLVSDMQLRTSGYEEIKEALDDDVPGDNGTRLRDVFVKRGFLGGDLGLGLDLGFSYNLNEQTTITGSVLDIGFIYHYSDPKNYTLEGQATTEGVRIILPNALVNPSGDFWQDLVDEIEELVPFEDNTNSYINFRPTKLYGSIRYSFGEPDGTAENCNCDYRVSGSRSSGIRYRNSLGGQLFVINRPRGPQAAVTAFYQRRFGRALSLKATYTADKFTFTNVGLGLNMQAGPVNLYLMADNLLAYQNIADSNYASFQFGLNIISWDRN
ncbi:DUF5723 family protein [Poritiphilus flavus]|uniref:DUF5723 domain-containing protein n=1 Tax=Poritiphilus flavus TaxID=2697053 RepID=A0A6L9EHP6_9FLAO|nr:DUF5723 family protein [Poritiphilus flavus]NAS14186.1 hypothetical protein [Poritiphilus flavus]